MSTDPSVGPFVMDLFLATHARTSEMNFETYSQVRSMRDGSRSQRTELAGSVVFSSFLVAIPRIDQCAQPKWHLGRQLNIEVSTAAAM